VLCAALLAAPAHHCSSRHQARLQTPSLGELLTAVLLGLHAELTATWRHLPTVQCTCPGAVHIMCLQGCTYAALALHVRTHFCYLCIASRRGAAASWQSKLVLPAGQPLSHLPACLLLVCYLPAVPAVPLHCPLAQPLWPCSAHSPRTLLPKLPIWARMGPTAAAALSPAQFLGRTAPLCCFQALGNAIPAYLAHTHCFTAHLQFLCHAGSVITSLLVLYRSHFCRSWW
jgi:hypothetical protein